MKAPDLGAAVALSRAALDPRMLQFVLVSLAVLVFLIYSGIALPAVWSAKPARRRAAADVLHQILDALHRRED